MSSLLEVLISQISTFGKRNFENESLTGQAIDVTKHVKNRINMSVEGCSKEVKPATIDFWLTKPDTEERLCKFECNRFFVDMNSENVFRIAHRHTRCTAMPCVKT